MRRRSISSSKVSLSSARPPGRWAAPVFLVALFMAAMCAPATADTGYSKGVFSPSACNGAGEFTCTSPYAVQTGWSGDPRTNEGICTTGTCYRTTTGTYTTGSATFEPNLLYSGWYKLQTCWGGVLAPPSWRFTPYTTRTAMWRRPSIRASMATPGSGCSQAMPFSSTRA